MRSGGVNCGEVGLDVLECGGGGQVVRKWWNRASVSGAECGDAEFGGVGWGEVRLHKIRIACTVP